MVLQTARLPRVARRLALLLAMAGGLLALCAVLLGAGRAQAAGPALLAAAAIAVNSTVDLPDANLGDNHCGAANGKCTLRAAIMQANFAAGPDTITVPAGVYLLTQVGQDTSALSGDLDISDELSLVGAGAGQTIVDGNGAVTDDRVFQVLNVSGSVSLSNLTIRNGQAVTFPTFFGGGLYWETNCDTCPQLSLTLSYVSLEGNRAQYGGGLYVVNRGDDVSQLNLDHVSLHGNTASGEGGGVFAAGTQLALAYSQVFSNTALFGGGLHLYEVRGGLIDHSEIYSNTASVGDGGGVYVTGDLPDLFSQLTIVDSSLHHNHAGSNGGAIESNDTQLVLLRTVLETNTSGNAGGGLMIVTAYGPAMMGIGQSTFSGNRAQFGGGLAYNGFDLSGPRGSLLVVNSTLSGNTASRDGGGIYGIGEAGIWLFNVTVAGNAAARGAGPFPRGGGVFITATAIITAQNTLIGDNLRSLSLSTGPDDCFTAPTTSLHSMGYNLIETLTNCSVSGTSFGNISGQDPLLGPLQHNGGTTFTRALLAGSPAQEAGDTLGCQDESSQLITTDQRGVPRPDGARCDIGAYELAANVGQIINFPAMPDQSLFAGPLAIIASATSGYTVTFSANTPAVCSVGASSLVFGNSTATVTLLKAGVCTLTAQQPGDGTYQAAEPVARTFNVTVRRLFLPFIRR